MEIFKHTQKYREQYDAPLGTYHSSLIIIITWGQSFSLHPPPISLMHLKSLLIYRFPSYRRRDFIHFGPRPLPPFPFCKNILSVVVALLRHPSKHMMSDSLSFAMLRLISGCVSRSIHSLSVDPRPASSASPGNLLELQILRLIPDLLTQKLWGELSHLWFHSPQEKLRHQEVWGPLVCCFSSTDSHCRDSLFYSELQNCYILLSSFLLHLVAGILSRR